MKVKYTKFIQIMVLKYFAEFPEKLLPVKDNIIRRTEEI